jgi:phosphatidylglycerol:prolipoprotein diacylglycerol transferase
MLPIILELPFFRLKSLTLLTFLALFFSAFIFWRRGREEHYDTFEIFDAFLSSGIYGFLVGRAAFVLFHLSQFKDSWLSVFDIFQKSGNEPIIALAAATWFLYRRSKKQKWDGFEILDFQVTAISLGMVFVYAGFFLDGSYGGTFTTMPWGIITPGTFEKTHPAQLYSLLYYLAVHIYLSRMEYVYRTLEWYRSGKKTAQSGFLFSTFLIFTGLFHVLTQTVRLPGMVVNGWVVDYVIYLGMTLLGCVFLFKRSGRSLWKKA